MLSGGCEEPPAPLLTRTDPLPLGSPTRGSPLGHRRAGRPGRGQDGPSGLAPTVPAAPPSRAAQGSLVADSAHFLSTERSAAPAAAGQAGLRDWGMALVRAPF